jgi:thiosulfate reductase/polysulfide reductase chain A
MLNHSISRRAFLKGVTAMGAGLTMPRLPGLAEWRAARIATRPDRIVPTTCDGCGNRCGILVYIKDGYPWRVVGNPAHAKSKGKVCARGHALVREVFNPDRLSQPLKRVGEDRFEPISWEQAYAEIADRLNAILHSYGPGAIFWVDHPKPFKYYADRFMAALGSPNMTSHPTTCYTGRDVGFIATLGALPSGDYSESRYIVLIGRNPAEGVTPAILVAITAARDKGAKLVVVDPRLNNTAIMANEWLAVRPGTDLALLLAWAHVLIGENLYDADFVTRYGEGFAEFAQAVQEYTPEWAAEITTIPAETIRRIAREMATARPRVFIDPSWHGAFGAHYANSSQTARAVAIVNALLGSINRVGGLIFPKDAKLGDLDPGQHPAPPKPELPRADGAGLAGQFPLALAKFGIPQRIPELIESGVYKAGFTYHLNPARTLPDRERTLAALRKLELLVVIDIYPSETAMLAHYVLPESMYIERDGGAEVVPGKQPQVVIRQQALPPVGNTRRASLIATELAQAVGLGNYFNFSLEELNRARLAPLGVSLEELKQKGVMPVGDPWQEGMPADLATPSKKVEFFSKRFQEAGFEPLPLWRPPRTQPPADDPQAFRLIHGHQAIHTHSTTADCAYLMGITHRYHLERLWLNAGRARALGIQDGDWVVVENEHGKGAVQAHITEGLHPDCVWLASGYGGFSAGLQVARGVGISPNDFMVVAYEPISAHAMMAEVIVQVRKATLAEASLAQRAAGDAMARWQEVVKAERRMRR